MLKTSCYLHPDQQMFKPERIPKQTEMLLQKYQLPELEIRLRGQERFLLFQIQCPASTSSGSSSRDSNTFFWMPWTPAFTCAHTTPHKHMDIIKNKSIKHHYSPSLPTLAVKNCIFFFCMYHTLAVCSGLHVSYSREKRLRIVCLQ